MENTWQKIKTVLSGQIPPHIFRMWIEPLEVSSANDQTIQLVCPNLFFRKRVKEHFGELIRLEFEKMAGRCMQLDFTIIQSDATQQMAVKPAKQLPLPQVTVQPHGGRLLRKDYTFDQFVVGQSNDFAYSAALSLAAHKHSQQNALFLLSKTGMGKSHLSQAIGHHILKESPTEKVYYMTAEDFTNEMVTSYKTNSIGAFKDKYHKACDVLLLEDIHYLSGKDRTQIELAHTLDSLYNENKKIIFSSCHTPSEIPKLNENLRSRLICGLISNIDPPDFRTRVKILKKYAQANKWIVPNDVFDYLATELAQDVRQLKSGLVGVSAKASLLGCPADVKLAASVVENMIRNCRSINITTIKKLICKYYNVTTKELVSRSRKQSIVRPRQVAIYLARRYTDQPLQSIGKSFNRYHATALHAIGVVERGIKQGGVMRQHVEYLCRKLESGNY